MRSIEDYATWAPLVALMRVPGPGEHVAGYVGRGSWSVPAAGRQWEAEFAAAERVIEALTEAGLEHVSFVLEGSALHLITFGQAVESGVGANPAALLLVEGAVPAPWRRLPDPVDSVRAAATADPELLASTFRERLLAALDGSVPDGFAGATDAEIAAAEARLGVALPAELKALYQVFRGGWLDFGEDYEASSRFSDAVGFELMPIEEIYFADAASRPCPWLYAATEAAVVTPDDVVQGLVGSPGWIAFADNGGGDKYAIDLTPGARGHLGQVIFIGHEQSVGAELLADSLTDLVVRGIDYQERGKRLDTLPAVAHVNDGNVPGVEAAANPDLEVLSTGVWSGAPFHLGPVVGLPRLRTLSAYPGTLADPLEIANLTGLEFLQLSPEDWRVLMDAGAVPRGLSAAAIESGNRNPLVIMELANEILALWNRPLITRVILERPVP